MSVGQLKNFLKNDWLDFSEILQVLMVEDWQSIIFSERLSF